MSNASIRGKATPPIWYFKTHYPYEHIPLTDRAKVAEKLCDTYQDHGRGQLEYLHDRVNKQVEVISAILAVVPETALVKIIETLGHTVTTSTPKDN